MIGISYHHDLKEVQGDPVLAGLIAARAHTPFDRLEWWQGLEAECGLKPLIAVAREGEDVAILPLQAGNGHLHALGNWYSFAVRPILSGHGVELLAALAHDLRRRAWRITMGPLPDEEGSATLLAEAFGQSGWSVARQQCDVNRFDDLARYASYAAFLADRPGQLRTALKRKAGKVEIAIHLVVTDAIWSAYEAVYRASWKPEEGSFAFLRRFAVAEAAAGRLRLGLATRDGAPVAAQLWTLERGTAFIHKLAHTDAAKALSPGTTLSAALFAHVIDIDRAEAVDFGTGDDAYKRDWMNGVRPRFRLDLLDPLSPRAWPHMVRATARRLVSAPVAG